MIENKFLNVLNDAFLQKDIHFIQKLLVNYIEESCPVFKKHPLGFYYIKFFNADNLIEFRLHIWNDFDNNDLNILQIHNHSFEFTSLVLTGSIKNILYSIKSCNKAAGFLYNVRFKNGKDRIYLNSNNTLLNEIKTDVINKGSFYSIKINEFHKSVTLDDFSITLIKINRHVSQTAQIYSKYPIKKLPSTDLRNDLEENENEVLIKKILANIK